MDEGILNLGGWKQRERTKSSLNSGVIRYRAVMEVRPASEADASAIAEVHVRSWQRAYAELMPAAILEELDPERRAADWREELRNGDGEALVATQRGEIVGFSYFSRSRDNDASENTGEVQAIYVDPSCWRQGIGTVLLHSTLSRLEALGFMEATLWVLEENRAACHFYSRSGFAKDAKRKTHPPTGLVEVRYLKPLLRGKI